MIHEAAGAEIEARFSAGKRRSQVCTDLRSWLRHMQLSGCRIVFIDGSFVTSKPEPADFDACFDPRGIDKTKLNPVLLDRSASATARIKQAFGGDIRIDKEWPPGSISPYM